MASTAQGSWAHNLSKHECARHVLFTPQTQLAGASQTRLLITTAYLGLSRNMDKYAQAQTI